MMPSVSSSSMDIRLITSHGLPLPLDHLPVVFHEYGICQADGRELDCQRTARLKNFSIYASVEEVKGREQQELAEALKMYGEQVDDGFEYHFEGECPIVAAYDYDEPCDVVVLAARVDKDGDLTLIVEEKDDRGYEHEIDPEDVFAGHLDYITASIK